MKDKIKSLAIIGASVAVLSCARPISEVEALSTTKCCNCENTLCDSYGMEEELRYFDSVIRWYNKCDSIGEAIAWVESRNDTFAHNSRSGARGALQITKLKMLQCNKYLRAKFGEDCDTFVVDDCYDYDLSLYVFELDMEFNNPELDLDKAIRLWNPRHSARYAKEVKSKYNELKGGE